MMSVSIHVARIVIEAQRSSWIGHTTSVCVIPARLEAGCAWGWKGWWWRGEFVFSASVWVSSFLLPLSIIIILFSFRKFDAHDIGVVSPSSILWSAFSPSTHPAVRSGQMTKEQAIAELSLYEWIKKAKEGEGANRWMSGWMHELSHLFFSSFLLFLQRLLICSFLPLGWFLPVF